MTYSKPEIAALGEAYLWIRGGKNILQDGPDLPAEQAFELED